MDGTKAIRTFIICLLPVFEQVLETAAVYCTYNTDIGVEYTYCQQQCCSGQVSNKEEACCEFTHSNGVYIGASLGTMILVGVIFLCLSYICCKHRMMQRVRESSRSNFNTRVRSGRHRERRHRHHDTIPSVSLAVEPIQPPPYETLDFPPPYFPVAGTSDNKPEDKSYINEPPPAYSQNVESDK